MATVNVSKARADNRVFHAVLDKLVKGRLAKWSQRMWLTTATVAASVSGTDLDDDIKVGDLLYSTGTGNNIFICTVVPSSDDGTFVKLNA